MKNKKLKIMVFCLQLSLVWTVVDGDSLENGKRRVRLYGIDAPEYNQKCTDKVGNEYPCGKKALDFLKLMVEQNKVKCEVKAKDRYKRQIAECFAKNENLNKKMLENGWAVAYKTSKEEYLNIESKAKENKRGVWQGKFMRPEFYRVLHRK